MASEMASRYLSFQERGLFGAPVGAFDATCLERTMTQVEQEQFKLFWLHNPCQPWR